MQTARELLNASLQHAVSTQIAIELIMLLINIDPY
jgi:hypothetical protein